MSRPIFLRILAVFLLASGAASASLPTEKSPVRRKIRASPKEAPTAIRVSPMEASGASNDDSNTEITDLDGNNMNMEIMDLDGNQMTFEHNVKDEDVGNMHCVVWGDSRVAGKPAGYTKMFGRHFETLAEAEEFFNGKQAGDQDIAMLYEGTRELNRHVSTRMTNAVSWRVLFDWCKSTSIFMAPELFRTKSFVLSPVTKPKLALKPHAISMKQKRDMEFNDEDEGPPTAFVDELEKLPCVVTARSDGEGQTKVNTTLFESMEDAEKKYFSEKAFGADLVIQYTGKREAKRYVSPAVTRVPWLMLIESCKRLEATRNNAKTNPKRAEMFKGKYSATRDTSAIEIEAVSSQSLNQQGTSPKQARTFVLSQEESAEYSWSSAQYAPVNMSHEYIFKMMKNGMKRQVLSYVRMVGWECQLADQSDINMVGVDLTAADCKSSCDKDLQCSCVQYDKSNGACYTAKFSRCNEKKCKKSKTNSIYLQRAHWTKDTENLKLIPSKDCATHRGAKVLGREKSVSTVDGCRDTCGSEKGCTCFNYNKILQTCTIMKECTISKCEDDKDEDLYMHMGVFTSYALRYEGIPW